MNLQIHYELYSWLCHVTARYFLIYMYCFFIYILHSVKYLMSRKDGSLSLSPENKIKLLYVLSLCPVAFIPGGTWSTLVADVCHARLHSQENPHTIPHSDSCSALARAASWAETDPEQLLNTNHKKGQQRRSCLQLLIALAHH